MIVRMAVNGSGILIAIEGIDGAGKTTQVGLLERAFAQLSEPLIASKEPTDGEWGRKIRASAQNGRMALDEELAAFIADRREHVQDKIQPALDSGKIVLLDRYFYSTIAYQGARGADVEKLSREMRAEFPVPDVTLLFDISPESSITRIAGSRGDIPNQFERVDQLRVVRDIFLGLAESDTTILKINATNDQARVFQDVIHALLATVLKSKRCAKAYGCDVFYCAYRETGDCRWAELTSGLNGHFHRLLS